MKKWSGGTLILVLSFVLVVRYTYFGNQPPKPIKQSAYDFFRNHPSNDSQAQEISSNSKSSEINVTKVEKIKEKPHLIDVEGLSDLYSTVNASKEDMKSFATWPQLRAVLLRSDGLPETSKGVKEASVAWRELISIIKWEKSKSAGDVDNVNRTNEIKCPFSVGTFDEPLNSSRRLLELPCGLIEDSSVTLIGIPNGRNRSFQIELEGAGFPHEQMPPIILHYNVYLPEENSTNYSVIVQNTWTNEVGWGKEERCPGGRSTNYMQVDGLASCYEQLIRSAMEENQNKSLPVGDKKINNSVAHAHIRANFPFSEGSPFTATLWAGLEGFHMAVNGRHETAFKYKENLEPWLVSKVKVTGGVSILSGIAKGLPVSEDLDIVFDAGQLKAPSLLKRRVVLLVGVFSTGNNFERRMALRRSWMQYEAVRSGIVAVRFLIGFHKNAEVNLDLWKEAQAYGDIQLMPFVDYYSLISLKTIAVCILGTKIIPAKYIMKIDDDAFVRIDVVLSNLKEKSASGLLYGLISFQSSPHRDQDSKWFVSEEEWPKDSFPPWAHGPGYIISRDIAKYIVRSHQERDLKLFKLEDVAMGIWIEKYKDSGHEVKYISDDRFHHTGCDADYILAHYQNPRKVLCLWEKLQKEHQAVCCE
ncbi:hydroxyproline O-galactosyltransferase GALT3-like [Chenopodium quinoa]|uniref:hydroxyproline O-galactosyltransferase GALT3-like n=1 Tax=Chenopodium quinoa TaxID=63459 RepID=UPI000B772873|nr:hydroxyproline O-galactosyltransferase GALT3-like [Chenopodium quinoa]XP_021757002.1 hydroxyproline O-galactosyltransferase GALT3-like [Chenopodium quinoa]XP_021757004.1 hydroxyproline O-galactosyltransferase GALT3-like [Chenopodium quinoa]XP_021757005.1 hydroxyproline O-galactosyltransferase GALT3-like [Chenopodium quinoa]